MKDSNQVIYTSNMLESQKKEKHDGKKNKKSEEHKEVKFEKDEEGSLKKLFPNKRKQKTIHGERKMQTQRVKENQGSNSKLSLKEGMDANDHVQQATPKSMNRFPSSEYEYNWRHPNTLENKKSEVHIEDKTEKDQEGTFEETLPNKQKQKVIHGELESFGEDCLENNSNGALMKINIDNTNDKKDEDYQVSERITKDTISNFLLDVCEMLRDEISKEHNESNIRKEQKDSFEEELPDQQQEEDINGEVELNRVTCDGSLLNNSDPILNDNNVNFGSKLWARDENTRYYRIMQGIPRSIKFRSINNLYQCTDRLSSVEDEFSWNLSTKEDPNMSLSIKEDSSIKINKKNVGCERKCSKKKNDNEENDDTTSSI